MLEGGQTDKDSEESSLIKVSINVKSKGPSYDIVQSLIDFLLNQTDRYFSYNPESENDKLYDFSEDRGFLNQPWNHYVAFYLTNLAKQNRFIEKYKASLPLELYSKSIK